ncbi:Humj1 family protein [Gossypium australe]|uniref:Humj1 family protein n=1 Tax=Gossypium australe TaxID=47621 RepID=A0A5B6VFV9_9ROSI|nr:Humj1 family protein [Gossypium australe]
MTAPHTAAITAALRNCSLNHETTTTGVGSLEEEGKIRRPTAPKDNDYGTMLCSRADYGGDSYLENDDDGGCDDDDNNWYDSEESSPSSSFSSSRDYKNDHHSHGIEEENDDVLVVAGCKSCYMYFMVAKKTEGCPKCNGQLLRFDHHHE